MIAEYTLPDGEGEARGISQFIKLPDEWGLDLFEIINSEEKEMKSGEKLRKRRVGGGRQG